MIDDLALVPRYALNGGSLIPVNPGRVRLADEAGMSSFVEEMKRVLAGAREIPDPVLHAKSRAVQAHTVIRQGDQVVAAIWRDGQSQMSNALGSRLDWSTMERRTGGMTDAQRRDYIAQEIMKHLDKAAVKIERYGETGPSPTRGAIDDEQARINLKARGSR